MTDSLIQQVQFLYQTGQGQSALAMLSRALDEAPDHHEYRYLRSQLALSQNDMAQAEIDLEYLIEHASPNALYFDDRGVMLQSQGDFLRATDYHLKATELNPTHDGILLNLAIALTHLNQKQHATQLYHDVIRLNSKNTRARVNLAVLLFEKENYAEAVDHLTQAKIDGDNSFELYMGLANCYRLQQKKSEAIEAYEQALRLKPDNASAQFMLSALKGESINQPPADHVADLFNSYADHFDSSLVEKLNYQSPQTLFSLIKPFLEKLKEKNSVVQGIDLGAGTGLFGKLVRPFCDSLIGIDLSEKMLHKAQQQAIYDLVAVADIHRALEVCEDRSLQLISAADVLVYIGDLAPLFSLAKKKIDSSGIFCFTTEVLLESESSLPFVIRDTGRYAHSDIYLKNLATEYGFAIEAIEKAFIRNNKDTPLDGYYVVLKPA